MPKICMTELTNSTRQNLYTCEIWYVNYVHEFSGRQFVYILPSQFCRDFHEGLAYGNEQLVCEMNNLPMEVNNLSVK